MKSGANPKDPALNSHEQVARSREVFVFPTTFAQRRLWFLDRLSPDNAFYNCETAFRLTMPLEVEVLQRSVDAIVRRHESLRTTFRAVKGEPIQVVAPELSIPIELLDLRGIPQEEREDEAGRVLTAESSRPFDLAAGPLLRCFLIQLDEEDFILLLVLHHIVADGWSLDIFFQELSSLYSAFSVGEEAPLEELPIQYGDYAVWQREQLQGEELDRLLGYWKEQLADLPRLSLPADFAPPSEPSYLGAAYHFKIAPSLQAKLSELSRAEGVTLFMTLLAAFQVLLCRYTRQDDIVVCTPIANRTRSEIEGLIGFFVNNLIMRTDLSGNPSFRQALQRVREVCLAAYAHQEMPFEKLVEAINPERNLSGNPLFQVSMQLFTSESQSDSPAPAIDSITVEKGTANIDLALDLIESSEGLVGRIEYMTDLFHEETIAGLASHFETLLGAIVEQPDARVQSLPLLSQPELGRILNKWNQTASGYSIDICPHELFQDQARRAPERIAATGQEGSITYGELLGRSQAVARKLSELGLQREARVGVCAGRSIEMLSGLLGILQAGGVYVPLDPDSPIERLQHMMLTADISLVMVQRHLADRIPSLGQSTIYLDEGRENEPNGELKPPPRIDPESLAYVIYTSGSTGRPKPVMTSHRALSNHLLWMQQTLPLTPGDAMLHKYSLSFDASLVEILSPLIAGARLVIARSGGDFDARYLVKLMKENRVSVIDAVPSLLEALLDSSGFCEVESLRRIQCGGEALTGPLRSRLLNETGAELHNLYGPAEAAIGVTAWPCRKDDEVDDGLIGRPIANTMIYLLDDYLQPVPPGVRGEIFIAGESLARGYLNDPVLTAERFLPDPFSSKAGRRMYRTGDAGRYRCDGVLKFEGRMDRQIKLRGVRIELGEIEAVLQAHPGVRHAAVMLSESAPQQTVREPESVFSELVALGEAGAAEILSQVERETGFQEPDETNPVPEEVIIRRQPEFDVSLRIKKPGFIQPPRAGQRDWILRRAIDELSDQLKHLHGSSERLVAGSPRTSIRGNWSTSKAESSPSDLVIEGQQVMQDWERPLMKALARAVTRSRGDILEVGFGMGISASFIQKSNPRSHTIIECNRGVIESFEEWRAGYPQRDIRLVEGRWQDVSQQLGDYDGILFDTYPTSEKEFVESVTRDATFAEPFFSVAATCLRKGGVFTYYSNEVDSLSRRHQRALLRHFDVFTVFVVDSLHPPPDCNYWWADSMAVVCAVK